MADPRDELLDECDGIPGFDLDAASGLDAQREAGPMAEDEYAYHGWGEAERHRLDAEDIAFERGQL